MQKFIVQLMLEHVREVREQASRANRDYNEGMNKVLASLLHHAALNFMSSHEVGKALGMSPSRVRTLMKANGLNPTSGKRLLSEQAAKALAENAELMGIEPSQMDLMSPLAYLPMGEQLRKQFLETEAVAQGVHEVKPLGPEGEAMATRMWDLGLSQQEAEDWIREVIAEAREAVAQGVHEEVEQDTLAEWLHHRFGPLKEEWAEMSQEDRDYWEHTKTAVLRAVKRGGFKNPREAREAGA